MAVATTERRVLALVPSQKNITESESCDGEHCPLALAFADAGYPGVSVEYLWIHSPLCTEYRLAARYHRDCIKTPADVQAYITLVDLARTKQQVYSERFVFELPAGWPEPEW